MQRTPEGEWLIWKLLNLTFVLSSFSNFNMVSSLILTLTIIYYIHLKIRQVCVEKGAGRVAALLNDVVLKRNPMLNQSDEEMEKKGMHDMLILKKKVVRSATRLRSNLEMICGEERFEDMSERDKKYFLNREVNQLIFQGDRNWKPPK